MYVLNEFTGRSRLGMVYCKGEVVGAMKGGIEV
jgi:hypothetical protein